MLFSNKDLKKLIVPLIIEQFLAVAVGMIDTMMISGAGEAAVSGVSLVDSVNVLLINLFAAFATGGAVVAGHCLGSGDGKGARKTANQLILFSGAFATCVMALVFLARNVILTKVFGQIEADVMASANIYLIITALSFPFMSVYNAGAALFRAIGNSKVTMWIAVCMNLINIVGNAVLIFGFGMGVMGAAISTTVSRIVAAVLVVVLLRNKDRAIYIDKQFDFRFQKEIIAKILYIGVPNGLENSMFQLGKILVLSLVSTFGTYAIAANAVSNTIAMFQILPGMAINMALLSVAAQCVGASDYDQARYYTKKLMQLIHIITFVFCAAMVALSPELVKLYHLSDAAADITVKIVCYHAICAVIIWPASFSLPNTLRAASDVKFAMILSTVSMWVFRIGFSYILGKYMGWGVFGVWVAMTIDWVFRAIFFTIRYRSGKWELHFTSNGGAA